MEQAETYYITKTQTVPEGGLGESRCAVYVFNYTGQVITLTVDGNSAQALKLIPFMGRTVVQRIRKGVRISIPQTLHKDEYVEVIFFTCDEKLSGAKAKSVYEEDAYTAFKKMLREVIREVNAGGM